MVDLLTIIGTHGVLLYAAWKIMWHDDLDVDPPTADRVPVVKPWLAGRAADGSRQADDTRDA